MIRGLHAPILRVQCRENRILALSSAALVLLQFRFLVNTLSRVGIQWSNRAVVPDSQWLVRSSMIPSFSSSTRYQCAPWLTRSSQRKVAFIDLAKPTTVAEAFTAVVNFACQHVSITRYDRMNLVCIDLVHTHYCAIVAWPKLFQSTMV
jgi:hypothetical protein